MEVCFTYSKVHQCERFTEFPQMEHIRLTLPEMEKPPHKRGQLPEAPCSLPGSARPPDQASTTPTSSSADGVAGFCPVWSGG